MKYRICWCASSNVTFKGHSDWNEWEEEGHPNDVLCEGSGVICRGLEEAIEGSGFEWWIEVQGE